MGNQGWGSAALQKLVSTGEHFFYLQRLPGRLISARGIVHVVWHLLSSAEELFQESFWLLNVFMVCAAAPKSALPC